MWKKCKTPIFPIFMQGKLHSNSGGDTGYYRDIPQTLWYNSEEIPRILY